uniref:FBA_2 domain-containing protein n=1 Tax=Caenorhabditis tropicalis TaxID=1561998 RepID=A0A1I7TTV1_9PELO
MTTFPLLKLPILAQEVVVRQWDVKLIRKCIFSFERGTDYIGKIKKQIFVPCNPSYSNQEKQIEEITKTLHSIIRFKTYSFRAVNVGIDSIVNCFLWKYSKKLEKFQFYQNAVDRQVTVDHLNFLFKEITVVDMVIELKTDTMKLDYKPEFNYENLNLSFVNSISFDSFLSINCHFVDIRMPKISSEEIIRFIESWMVGNLESIVKITFEITNDVFDEQVVFDHFNDKTTKTQIFDREPLPNEKTILRDDGFMGHLIFGLRKFEFHYLTEFGM